LCQICIPYPSLIAGAGSLIDICASGVGCGVGAVPPTGPTVPLETGITITLSRIEVRLVAVRFSNTIHFALQARSVPHKARITVALRSIGIRLV